MMAIDSRGSLYVGETVGGRRIQKFNRDGDVPDHKLDLVSPAANPNMVIPHYDPVK